MIIAAPFSRKMLSVIYELDEFFYNTGMTEPTLLDTDAWFNISWI